MENRIIEITIENDQSSHTFSEGTSLRQILKGTNLKDKDQYIAAYVDNSPKILTKSLYKSHHVRFISKVSEAGARIYTQSAQLIMEKAIYDITGKRNFRVIHSVEKGIFVEVENISEDLTCKIRERMNEIIECDMPFLVNEMEYNTALEFFRKAGFSDKEHLLETSPSFYIPLNEIDGYVGLLFGGTTVPSTGYINSYELYHAGGGLVLLPGQEVTNKRIADLLEKPKFYHLIGEYKRWSKLMDIANAGDINRHILEGRGKYLVMIGEALHEKRIAISADKIVKNNSRIVLIAGPSSSGKTTFSKRLAIQLIINGLEPVIISMDDYFVERGRTPKDKDGNYDFECLEAVDIELFNSDMHRLLSGETVEIPTYDFITGQRVYKGNKVVLNEGAILIVEGIHALNPTILTEDDRSKAYKIYVSAMTPLSIDSENIIHISDNRLIRRIIRDYRTRGRSASDTLACWKSVRDGEQKNIFPFQENCDDIINTALFYELSVLAPKVSQILRQIPRVAPEYAEAKRLIMLLSCFLEIPENIIPPSSLLREFIGGSVFAD